VSENRLLRKIRDIINRRLEKTVELQSDMPKAIKELTK
jgi:hypothetical protein